MATESDRCVISELPIVCPQCANHGEPDGAWQANAGRPFKLIEDVVRSWTFVAVRDGSVLRLIVDAASDSTDSDSGTNMRVECMQCFASFTIPVGADLEFE